MPVATHEVAGFDEDGQLVERALGFELGDDADEGVDDDDEAENGVLPPSGEQHDDHGGQDDAVEQREHVGGDDLPHGARRLRGLHVHLAVRHPVGHLPGGEPALIDRRHGLRRA